MRGKNLVLASRCSLNITSLRVSNTRLSLSTLGHHDSEGNIGSLGILVEGLTGENSRSIGGVS
jgi:hypothetical protein